MIRWALLGDWIIHDRDCHNTVIATLCRGIGVLDREDEFAAVSNSAINVTTSSTPVVASPGFAPIVIKDPDASGASPPVIHSGFASLGSGQKKKNEKSQTAASKLFVKVRASTAIAPAVSTGTKDAGVGLPTFATLSAEMYIKIAAETALGQLSNHLGNFPPFGEVTGVSRLSSIWNEEKEVRRLLIIREKLRMERVLMDGGIGVAADDSIKVADYKRFVRFFAYDNRVILGLVEIPHWSLNHDIEGFETDGEMGSLRSDQLGDAYPRHRTPAVVMVLRDGTGKYTWMGTLKYVDQKDQKKVESKSSAPMERRPSTVAALRALFEKAARDSETNLHTSDDEGSKLESSGSRLHRPSVNQLSSGHHFIPPTMPYQPANATVVQQPCVNDTSIPALDHIIAEGTDAARSYEIVKKLTQRQIEKEAIRTDDIMKREMLETHPVEPPPVPDKLDPDVSSQAFRLLLAQSGYLTLENRPKLAPLPITQALMKDLAKLDLLPERECMAIGVLFCRSGAQPMEEIFKPETISYDFHQFVHTLGWPVNIAAHAGFKGYLNPSLCETAPYYGSRSTEVIFHVPYYIKFTDIKTPEAPAEEELKLPTSPTATHPTSTIPPLPPDLAFLQQLMQEDIVYIVWVEDRDRYLSLPWKLSRTSAQLLIVVQPMPTTPALYWVKMLSMSNSNAEDHLVSRPL
ncbi:Ral GTPase-activating protein subunit alpha-1 [Rhizophlyctis rosea]|nr:Ral GTPase-activating protein subunit alpha-1 [Rhizophlyctis rosea]